jgi:1-acyl-sn-glycerol-3-phosphate acyltransferase
MPRDLEWVKSIMRAALRGVYDYTWEGAENIPALGPVVIVANHPTFLDPLTLGLAVKRPVIYMAWDQPFTIPFVGGFMRAFGAIPVAAQGAASRESILAALRVLHKGGVLAVFPEGMRSTGRRLLQFRPGAARLAIRAGAPIVPASITGGMTIWPKGRKYPRLRGRYHIVFHAPVMPCPEDSAPGAERTAHSKNSAAEELLGRVRAVIRGGIDYPAIEDSFPERPSMRHALREEGIGEEGK